MARGGGAFVEVGETTGELVGAKVVGGAFVAVGKGVCVGLAIITRDQFSRCVAVGALAPGGGSAAALPTSAQLISNKEIEPTMSEGNKRARFFVLTSGWFASIALVFLTILQWNSGLIAPGGCNQSIPLKVRLKSTYSITRTALRPSPRRSKMTPAKIRKLPAN
jgi:hypothetical protein